jgi:transposase, IS5 family
MKQTTLVSTGFERHRKTTHRAQFLAQMHQVVPWATLCALIEPHCREGLKSPPSVGIAKMLRIYFLQQWFSLSDATAEEALYDSVAMREFVGIDLGREPAPDQTTIWRFRLLLEHRGVGRQLFAAVGQHLRAAGLKLSIGTIVDASIISAPSWIQRRDLARNPQRHQSLEIDPCAVPKSHGAPP